MEVQKNVHIVVALLSLSVPSDSGVLCPLCLQRTVAFSEFVRWVNSNEVGHVMSDGASNTFYFALRPGAAYLKSLAPGAPWAAAGRQQLAVCSCCCCC